MVQNQQESRLKYWATCSSVCSFACTAHSFTCSKLLASLARYAALTHPLARLLTPLLVQKWMIRRLFFLCFFSDLDHRASWKATSLPICIIANLHQMNFTIALKKNITHEKTTASIILLCLWHFLLFRLTLDICIQRHSLLMYIRLISKISLLPISFSIFFKDYLKSQPSSPLIYQSRNVVVNIIFCASPHFHFPSISFSLDVVEVVLFILYSLTRCSVPQIALMQYLSWQSKRLMNEIPFVFIAK